MAIFLFILIGLFLLGIGLLWFVWRTTKNLKSIWLREVLRALAIAIAFTPSLSIHKGAHIAVPAPAIWLVIGGISEGDRDGNLSRGSVSLAVATGIICLFRIPIAYSAEKRRKQGRRNVFNQPFFPDK